MNRYVPHQARYFAEQIALKRSQSSMDGLVSAMSGVKVDLNPHQVDAALFAMRSPLSNGALLADEVGLGKTVEAGLVLAQYWSERKRKILLIVPAALRMQWRAELAEKFYIDSLILESANFNRLRKEGRTNPFDVQNQVVICSYNFAAKKSSELKTIRWDLVIMDEAHRLRNVYKSNNVTGKKLKEALAGRKKLVYTMVLVVLAVMNRILLSRLPAQSTWWKPRRVMKPKVQLCRTKQALRVNIVVL